MTPTRKGANKGRTWRRFVAISGKRKIIAVTKNYHAAWRLPDVYPDEIVPVEICEIQSPKPKRKVK